MRPREIDEDLQKNDESGDDVEQPANIDAPWEIVNLIYALSSTYYFIFKKLMWRHGFVSYANIWNE